MEVCMDTPNKIQKYKKYKSTHNLAIFEIQTPDFAWKFIWTVEPNDKVKSTKSTKLQKYKTTKVQNRIVQKYNKKHKIKMDAKM